VWSPDGTRIAYCLEIVDTYSPHRDKEGIYVFEVDTRSQKMISPMSEPGVFQLTCDGLAWWTENTIIVKELFASQYALDGGLVFDESVICPWEEAIEGISPNCKQISISSDLVCSELTNLRIFGQWLLALDDGSGPLLAVVTNQSMVNYDPTAQENLGSQISHLQGNLKQVRASRPRAVLVVGSQPDDAPKEMKQWAP